MTDSWASSDAVRRTMQGNRGRDTKPEMLVRRQIHAAGLRYRVSTRPLPDLRRTADIVLRPKKIAVFIDGCYWHGCTEHFNRPKTNPVYWDGKIGGNVRRDAETNALLEQAGWTALRFWEHEDPLDVARAIIAAAEARTPTT